MECAIEYAHIGARYHRPGCAVPVLHQRLGLETADVDKIVKPHSPHIVGRYYRYSLQEVVNRARAGARDHRPGCAVPVLHQRLTPCTPHSPHIAPRDYRYPIDYVIAPAIVRT